MKKLSFLTATFVVLLLVGAGCNSTEYDSPTHDAKPASNTTTDTDTQDTSDDQTTNEDTTNVANGELTLSATAMKNRTVKFEWTPSDELAEKAESWRLVYSKDENPTYPATWWWERSKTYREHEWTNMPTGEGHIRVCAVVDDECMLYSNDVMIDVE